MKQILNSFQKSVSRLEEILKEPETIANRDSAIKRFELTFELAWKSIQKFLKTEGITARSPRECFQEIFSYGLIEDDRAWLDMIDARNQTVHTYNEETADVIYRLLPDYLPYYQKLEKKLAEKVN